MPWQPRRLSLENLESRRLLAAVSIPDDLTAQVGAQVTAPVMIDSAQGIRGAEIRIQYDPALLTLTPADITAGSAWGEEDEPQVVANVDQATGTVIVFISAPSDLPDVGGSLVNFAFGIRETAQVGDQTAIDLVEVRLNEGAIAVDPAPIAGPDSTNGQIIVVEGEPGLTDRIAGVVYADTDNNHLPGEFEGIPGVAITLINLQSNAQLQTTTAADGTFEFTQLPAGNYRLVQTHPLAYLDGGANEREMSLAAGQNLENQNFREIGLRAPYVYNRLMTTVALPVGSPSWIEVLRQINVDAASSAAAAPPQSEAVTAALSNVFAAATNESAQSELAQGESAEGGSAVLLASTPLLVEQTFSSTPPDASPAAEGESLAEPSAWADPWAGMVPPHAGFDPDEKGETYADIDQALIDLELW